jgi:hypothetical protein
MESIDKSNYIIIGKYYISKTIMTSFPPQLSVFDSETNTIKILFDSKVFELLKNEGLDTEPLHEYFDKLNGTTKKERLEWQKQFEEKKLIESRR